MGSLFHLLKEHCLINVIFALLPDLLEVGNAVGEQLDFIHSAKFCAKIINYVEYYKFPSPFARK